MRQLDLCPPPECQHKRRSREDGNSSRCLDCGAWLSSRAIAETRRDVGIALVMGNEEDAWKDRAIACVTKVAQAMREFTVEDIRDEMLRDGLGHPHHPNAIGGLFHTIKAKKIAVPTDRTILTTHVEGHRRAVRVWRSCLGGSRR